MKKLILGFSVAVVGVVFWACGTGSIEALGDNDTNAQELFGYDPDALNTLVADAKKNCADDESCVAAQEKAEPIKVESSESEEEPESSDSGKSEDPKPQSGTSGNTSSTSGGASATSSATPAATTSSSSTAATTSSSAIIVPTSSSAALGQPTCKASASEVDKGKILTWTVGLIGATMTSWSWTFEGGGPSVTTASGSKTAAVTYNGPSGATKTTVVVATSNGDKKTAECYAQVNGAPITGCSCKPNSPSNVDVAVATVEIEWTVSGCSASGATIDGYVWDGAVGNGNKAVGTYTEKGSYSPKVTVKSSEGSTTTVTCSEAKVVDGRMKEVQITSSELELEAGSYIITSCSGGGQLLCSTNGNGNQTITFNGADCIAYGTMGHGSCGGGSCIPNAVLVTEIPISCKGAW